MLFSGSWYFFAKYMEHNCLTNIKQEILICVKPTNKCLRTLYGDKKVIRNMEREATYDILQNKEGELRFCVRTREGEPENAGERIRAMIAANPAEAQRVVDFYITMADDGNVGAMYELGMLYWEGVGVEYDYGRARTWMERAAAQGDERALEFLADMPDDGGRYDGEV
jgi:TPR repeat protein